ncbi:MAG: hypothetical protein JRF15_11045 [Deltaproteobacteria bacterium]|jgi:hypothetical protein|nr:hypothetical protein [Deltaproteobacteria bacterium]
MLRTTFCCLVLLFIAGAAGGEDTTNQADKLLSGMSIVGNDEAPKSLVIVPWKSSELGDALGFSRALDDGRQPVDREVFKRQLDYYQIRLSTASMRVSKEK